MTANYWSGYGSPDVTCWLTLFDGDGEVIAEWAESCASEGGAIAIDSRRVREQFGLGEFAGQLFVHVAGAADSGDHCFDVNVEVVEQLGSEILLDARVGPALVVASVEPTLKVRAHDKLRLALKPERLHLFDAETEAAI